MLCLCGRNGARWSFAALASPSFCVVGYFTAGMCCATPKSTCHSGSEYLFSFPWLLQCLQDALCFLSLASPGQFSRLVNRAVGGFEGPAQLQKVSASSHKTEHGSFSDDSTHFSSSGISLRKTSWPLQRRASNRSYARNFTGGNRGGLFREDTKVRKWIHANQTYGAGKQ